MKLLKTLLIVLGIYFVVDKAKNFIGEAPITQIKTAFAQHKTPEEQLRSAEKNHFELTGYRPSPFKQYATWVCHCDQSID